MCELKATRTLFLDGLAALSRSEPPNLKAKPGIALSRFTGTARPKYRLGSTARGSEPSRWQHYPGLCSWSDFRGSFS
jgi:hypothetical protein